MSVVAALAGLSVAYPAAACPVVESVPLPGPQVGWHICAAYAAGEAPEVLAGIAASYGYSVTDQPLVVRSAVVGYCPPS